MKSTTSLKKRNTRRVALAAAGVVGLSLAGCAQADNGGGGDAEERTLTVQVQSAQMESFQYAADLFEEQHEGVTVELQTVTEEQKSSTNAQIMASANAPDIGLVPTNAQPYLDLIQADGLVPLDDVWADADLENRMDPATAESLLWEGTPYVVLFDTVFYNIVYYNTEAFAEAGVEVPEDHQIKTTEDLYGMVDKLAAAGYEGLAVGGNAGYQLGWLVDGQVFANASTEAFTDFATAWKPGQVQTVPFTSPEFTDSLQNINEWNENSVFQAGMLGQGGDQAQASFVAGSSAMFLGGTWIPSLLEDAGIGFEYDWLLLPGIDSPTLPTAYAGDTLAVPVTSKNQDLAKEFLALYVSDEVQTFAAQTVGSLPSVTTVDPASIPELGPLVQEIIEFTNTVGAGVGLTSVLPGALGGSFIDPEMQKLLSGQVTAEEVGEAQQAQFESFKAENG